MTAATPPRRCPECRAPRPVTGGSFCNNYCLHMWYIGRSEEFEADVAIALAAQYVGKIRTGQEPAPEGLGAASAAPAPANQLLHPRPEKLP